jgi:hypothetical protein
MAAGVELAKLTVNSVFDPSQVESGLAKLKKDLLGAKSAADMMRIVTIQAQTESAQSAISGLTGGLQKLAQQMLSMVGLNFETAMKFGTIAGFVGLIGMGVKKVIDATDAMTVLKATLKAVGLNAEEAGKQYEDFALKMARVTTLGKMEVLQLAESATRMGIKKDKALELTEAAIGLSARLGRDPGEILGALTRAQVEGGGSAVLMLLKRLSPEIRQAMAQGKDLQEVLSKLSSEGFEIWAAKMGTVTGQLNLMGKALGGLTKSIGEVFSPILIPIIEGITSGVTRLARWTMELVKNHRQLATVTAAVVLTLSAAAVVMNNLGVVSFIVSKIIVGPLLGAIYKLAAGLVTLALAHPITAVALAITSLAAAIGFASLEGDTMAAKWGTLVNKLQGWWTYLSNLFSSIWNRAALEVDIVVEALKTSWGDFMEWMKPVFDGIRSIWQGLVDWVGGTLAPVFAPVKEYWAFFLAWAEDQWRDLTAELSVLGLRIQMAGLKALVVWEAIPQVFKWFGDTVIAFGLWFATNWKNIFIESGKAVLEVFKLLGTNIKELFVGIWEFIKDPSKGVKAFDFSATFAQLDALKNQAAKVTEGLALPGLKIAVRQELSDAIAMTGKEIERKKAAARKAEDERRAALGYVPMGPPIEGKGGKDKDLGLAPTGEKKATFQDILGYYKSVTEGIAGGQDPNKKTADNTAAMNQQLVKIVGLMDAMMAGLRSLNPIGTLPG